MGFDIRKAVSAAILFFSVILFPLYGQQPAGGSSVPFGDLVNWAYGQDQELVNGMQYYNKHPRSLGHPYLLEGWAHQGSVSIRGKLYRDIWLKYNIHVQQVEVEYQTMNGADNLVILVGDRLDEFTIGEHYFRKLKLAENGQEQFYQVIGDGRMLLYIQWEKNLVPLVGDSRFIEEFSSPKRTYFLELDGSVQAFHNKKSFIALFPEVIQKDMKRLIKENRLLIKTASSRELELFILAAGSVLEGMD
ncbi:MAG: hypothetical protein U9R49_09785 [Bacteroidota bacterium]|nr:hypothetical protein [Bacteroidota bacterium]